MTGNTSYNLKYTVIDNAGNTGTATNTATTKKPEKNPGGVINDIISTDDGFIIPTENVIIDNLGKQISFETPVKTIVIPGKFTGVSDQTYTTDQQTKWFVFAETTEYLYIVSIGNEIKLSGPTGWMNQPGILDATAKAAYANNLVGEEDVRSLSWRDTAERITYANYQQTYPRDLAVSIRTPSNTRNY